MTLRKRPAAEQDLLSIWLHIANDDDGAADRLLDRIAQALRLLESNPQAGRARPELGENIRSFPIGRYLLFYVALEAGVELVRVLHGTRDVGAASFDD